jgi:tetratricopeptide (TPR) repeat protein
MNSPSLCLSTLALLVSSSGAWGSALPSQSSATGLPRASAAEPGQPLADAALAPYRHRLLELAFTTASALPLHPHVKDRSRAQEEVVDACIELGQLRTARGYADRIVNWRRGAACADLALACLERGATEEARACLAIAQEISDGLARELEQELEPEGVESPQDWQRDRIRVKMARVLVAHGEDAKAEALEDGVVESEAGRVDAVRARRASLEDFEVLIGELQAAVLSSSLERARHALEACLELFDRFYADPERRARAEAALRDPGAKLPEDVLIGLLRQAAEIALAHGDPAKALELVMAADARVKKKCGASSGWIPEHEIPLRAGLVGMRHRAGDRGGAEQELAAAASRYEEERGNIVEIYRAETVRPLAEAASAMGDLARALGFYRRALEEGAVNVNARQRAEDLAATCISMALHEVEPDAALWERILEIRAGLVAPW